MLVLESLTFRQIISNCFDQTEKSSSCNYLSNLSMVVDLNVFIKGHVNTQWQHPAQVNSESQQMLACLLFH